MKENIPRIHDSEYRFCLILWEEEPIKAARIVNMCLDKLGWARPTTYTVINRLVERGIIKLEDGIVSAVVSREQNEEWEIQNLIEKRFEGSIPAFLDAFHRIHEFSLRDLDDLQTFVDRKTEELNK